jgi:hypothetical protein
MVEPLRLGSPHRIRHFDNRFRVCRGFLLR